MIEKIYSRKRIFLPKLKFKKLNCLLFLILIIIIAVIFMFILEMYPVFKASCINTAGSQMVHIVHEEVQNVIKDYEYDDLIKLEKDENGNVILLQANTLLISKLVSQITDDIQRRIDESPTSMVYINFGSVSGVSILRNFGPKFNIEFESAGNIDVKTKSSFESTGVNQTLHRVYLDINAEISILTPLGVFEQEVKPEILFTEAVIVGKVPENYYNLTGIDENDTLNMLK